MRNFNAFYSKFLRKLNANEQLLPAAGAALFVCESQSTARVTAEPQQQQQSKAVYCSCSWCCFLICMRDQAAKYILRIVAFLLFIYL